MATVTAETCPFGKGLATIRAGNRRVVLFKDKIFILSRSRLRSVRQLMEKIRRATVRIRHSWSSPPADTKVQAKAYACHYPQRAKNTTGIHSKGKHA